jgi:phosphoglycolate phosphatase-like HAD superfamily hydrolase
MESVVTPKRLAWLFDVDGTLLVTEGAAHQAFVLAVRDVLGIDDDLADIAFAGRTEPLIVADILTKHERRFVDGEEPRFWNAVFDHMRQVFPPTRGRLLPGVPELLEAVEGERDWVSALLTGNMTQMARIKLMRFGIVDRFAFGAFGEEARDRNALAQVAVERAGRHGVPPERCVVVGDTEHDIACARAAGARVVAVATGPRTRAELEGLGADLALDDLTGTSELIAWARDVAEGR